jgi:hypothetical protein
MLLALIISGVFNHVLSKIASWNLFESPAAKVVIGISSFLLFVVLPNLVFSGGKQVQNK